jgi:hypothetical protein
MKRRPKVRQGVNRPVAVIETPPVRRGRKISEVIASMNATGAHAVLDEDFARDVEEAIQLHTQPWDPPSWD